MGELCYNQRGTVLWGYVLVMSSSQGGRRGRRGRLSIDRSADVVRVGVLVLLSASQN